MKAKDILEHFLSQADWVDRTRTVDRILMGDPERDIRRVLVTWMSTMNAVQAAVDGGYDMLMTHEPTFWIHANELETLDAGAESAPRQATAQRKRVLLQRSGIVLERNHDVWDRFPAVGIPWALARFLGVAGPAVTTGSHGYQLAFEIPALTAGTLAGDVARRMASVGEPAVQLYGDATLPIRRLGIGTGCMCSPDVFRGMGCDAAIVCDDGCGYWRDIAWAVDEGMPLLRVSHGASEEPGMATLTEYINTNLPGVAAEHFPLNLQCAIVRG